METQGFLQNSFRGICFFDTFISFDVADLFLCVHNDVCDRAPPSLTCLRLPTKTLFVSSTWGEKKPREKKKIGSFFFCFSLISGEMAAVANVVSVWHEAKLLSTLSGCRFDFLIFSLCPKG